MTKFILIIISSLVLGVIASEMGAPLGTSLLLIIISGFLVDALCRLDGMQNLLDGLSDDINDIKKKLVKLNFRNTEIAADFFGEKIVDFGMSWDRRSFALGAI